MKQLSIPAFLSLGILFYPVGEAQAATLSPEPQAIDLRTWTQEGDPDSGQWVVSSDGTSVRQTKNGSPTFFVSPEDFLDTTINGKLKVFNNDDDFIGFVFGYQSPIAANGDSVNEMEFLLFDWRKASPDGFSLAKVNGTIRQFASGFWKHESSPEFNVIATDYNSGNGWQNNTEYDFTLLYQGDRIKIDVDGNTIFDVSADEVGGGEFQPGRFGFYNFSQANVFYSGLTQTDTPPEPPETVPEPSSVLGLLGLGAVGVTGLKRKKQQNVQDDRVN